MAITVNLNNAQFSQFVQFAEKQANPANSEAIARVTGSRDALAGRTISAANTDKVYHWYNPFGSRSKTDISENNDARALFRDAVCDMFGGMENVPEHVKTAMRLEDYNQGKPLTARRIIAVRDAILQAADKVDSGAIDRPKAESLVDDAIRNFKYEMAKNRLGTMALGNNLRDDAIEEVRKYGKGLAETCQRILANYIVAAKFSEKRDDEVPLTKKLPVLANYLKGVRDFKPGEDYRLTGLDQEMKKYLEDVIADAKANRHEEKADKYGISAMLKEKIANPQQRQVIGAVMNRNLRDAIVSIHTRENLKATTNFPKLKLSDVLGAELTLTVPKADPDFQKVCYVGRAEPKFTLTVEGTKAKLVCEVAGNMRFKFNSHFANNGSADFFMGKVNNYVECEFDLSDPSTAKLTSVHFGQDVYDPPKRDAVEPTYAR